jgi:hypothetical protein
VAKVEAKYRLSSSYGTGPQGDKTSAYFVERDDVIEYLTFLDTLYDITQNHLSSKVSSEDEIDKFHGIGASIEQTEFTITDLDTGLRYSPFSEDGEGDLSIWSEID